MFEDEQTYFKLFLVIFPQLVLKRFLEDFIYRAAWSFWVSLLGYSMPVDGDLVK